MMIKYYFKGLFVIFLLALTWTTQAYAETVTEVQAIPITLQASNVLPKEMLAGLNYKIKETVQNDGFVNTYELDTTYGLVRVESTALLMIRLNEIKALQWMEELKETQVFMDALKEATKGPLKTTKGLVTAPVETVTGTVTGIGRWFSDVGRAVVSSDPHQEGAVKTAIGYAAAKRKFAYEFGVDPYSSFKPIEEALNDIAWTATGGGLTVKVAFAAIKDVPGTVLKATGTAAGMKKLVRDKSPAELDKLNKKKLKAMGVPDNLLEKFLENPNYNPQEKTLLVGALNSIKGVPGRDIFIRQASLAKEESVARFMRLRAEMMADYRAHVSPISRVVEVNGVALLQKKDGTIIGIFPLDYVAWTSALMKKESDSSTSIKKLYGNIDKELWITGKFDPVARNALQARGWTVEDGVGDKLIRVHP
ncbi:MAG: hypothetical protein JRF62_15090 [Deltaproteobacteria bacterium]|nr:hypothetical protein [Deltaproteobacteria bacterium]MBW2641556.1 hypothetical protein [Deltaproteobacteria bacterium]